MKSQFILHSLLYLRLDDLVLFGAAVLMVFGAAAEVGPGADTAAIGRCWARECVRAAQAC